MTHDKNPPLLIDKALTAEQRTEFLKFIEVRFPRMRGAHPADLIDILCDADAWLPYVDKVVNELNYIFGDWGNPGHHDAHAHLLRPAAYAGICLCEEEDLNDALDIARKLVSRAKRVENGESPE